MFLKMRREIKNSEKNYIGNQKTVFEMMIKMHLNIK